MKSVGKILIGIVVLFVVIIGGLGIYITTQFDPNEYRGIIASKVSEQMGRKVEINGPLAFSVFPSIKLSLKDVTLADADWGGKQPMIDVKELDASLELMPLLNKQIVIEGVKLKGATLNLTKSGERANWEFKKAEPAKEAIGDKNDKAVAQSAESVSLEVLALDISDTTLNYKDGDKITKLLVKNAKTSLRPSQPLELVADGEINDKPIKINVKGDKLETLLSGGKNFPLQGNIEAAGSKIEFDGNIKNPNNFSGADFKISVRGNGKELGALTGSPLPFGNFDLKTNLAMPDKNTANLNDLEFSTGETKVSGQIKAGLGGSKPNISGNLNIPRLNVADFADKAPATATPELEKKKESSLFISPAYAANGEPLIPAIPLPAEALRGINANLKLNIGEIINEGKNIAGFDGTVAINDGNLNVSPMKLQYAKNVFTGNIGIDGRSATPVLTVNLNSDKLDYGALLKELDLNDRISGTGALSVNLTGSGKDLRQAMGSSRGNFKLTSNEGEFATGILFDGVGNVLRMALPGYSVPNVAHLRCANFAFTGQNGVWQTTNSAADSDVLALQMSGEVNLATEKVNFKAFPNMKAVKTGGLIPPIKIAGPMTKPAVIVDGSGLAQSAVTAAVLGKAKGVDILRSLGTTGETTPTTDTSGNSCLAAVQATAASVTSQKSTGEQAKDLLNQAVPKEKQEKVREDIKKGLQGLFGKKPTAAPAPAAEPAASAVTAPAPAAEATAPAAAPVTPSEATPATPAN